MKARGLLLIWLDEDIGWHDSATGKRVRRRKYSEAAIQSCLIIKSLFNIALCQAMHCAKPAQAG
ncbi:hypothetical protein GCM10011572_51710 [Pseudoduganella buxea]|uniref:Transposase DDE domain-containing protein n=1 Tax=Pseudoduganella buxea TaxID=1949069 RepID=A0ABQ1LL89_9BURK|nr:hypothetical protein GCM10011572_51710 [Pseudoduganella buxea]